MELLVGLASLTIGLYLISHFKLPLAANLAATAFVCLVLYILMYSFAASTAGFITAIGRAATSTPAFIPLFFVLGLGAGYFAGRRGIFGGGGPFKSC